MRVILLISGLLLGLVALAAEAGMKAGPNMAGPGHHRLKGVAGAPLDGFTAPAAAYSFRKLLTAYAGNAVQIRRASDSTTLDVGFTGTDFNTSAATTFCAATSCFLTTWYDQSGLGQHMTQATPANQPALIFNCTANLPCARMTLGSTQGLTAASVTPAAVISFGGVVRVTVGGSEGCYHYTVGSNQLNQQPALDVVTVSNGGTAFNAVMTQTAWHSVTAVMNGAASLIRVDAAETTGTVTAAVTAGVMWFAGATGSTCDSTERVWWNNYVLTPAERATLHADQKTYWGF